MDRKIQKKYQDLMNLNKKISVILTTFNSSQHISQTVESVLKQTYTNYELIIVDDCSTDNTLLKLKKYQNNNSKIKIFKTKKNSGTAALPRNLGLEKAKFDIICFIDGDDVWNKHKLYEQIKLIKKFDIIFSSTSYFYNKVNTGYSYFNHARILLQFVFLFLIKKNINYFYFYNPIVLSSVMIKKKLLINNLFNEDKLLAGLEDLELWTRIFNTKRIKSHFINQNLVSNRRLANSLHSNYNIQVIKIIYLNCVNYLKLKKIKNINYLLFSILIKVLRQLSKIFIISFINKIYRNIILLFFIIYILYYSPLLKYIGNNYLTHVDNFSPKQNIAILYSGYGYDKFYNFGYYFRYLELTNKKEVFKDKYIFLLYEKSTYFYAETLQKLLISDGFGINKIYLIEYNANNFRPISEIINKLQHKNITVFTAQYESYLIKQMFEKNFINSEIIIPKQLDYIESKYYIFDNFGYKKQVVYNLINKFKFYLNERKKNFF
jgi:teichuronic acid biosynthesis glycosyltransferase TuaG